MRRFLAIAMAVAVLAACGGEDTSDDTTDDSAGSTTAGADDTGFEVIEVTDIAYPASVTVPAGESVRFRNSSGVSHTVTFDTKDGAEFESESELGPTGVVDVPLDPGTYVYHCSFHPTMVGELIQEG
ncbi:MAG TPA: cupredoxin domain-containing protein [Acidimicrobiia bacterium]